MIVTDVKGPQMGRAPSCRVNPVKSGHVLCHGLLTLPIVPTHNLQYCVPWICPFPSRKSP